MTQLVEQSILRSAVRIQSSAKIYIECLLSTVLKRQKLRKRGRDWPISKKHYFLVELETVKIFVPFTTNNFARIGAAFGKTRIN